MSQAERIHLFDNWARNYDASLASSNADFPFDGYEQILDRVVSLAEVKPAMRILELGVGTGNLAGRFLEKGCEVCGVDFSAEMLAQTRAKLPQIQLVQADLFGDWPVELQRPYERVVSAYVFHEFPLASKIKLLQRLASRYISHARRIIIADISFPTVAVRAQASERWAENWDKDEYYWAADESMAALERTGLQAHYEQISSCGGIFILQPGTRADTVRREMRGSRG
jgi:ubiquinone/menaquinone biosynthesis C-methylase UbiE